MLGNNGFIFASFQKLLNFTYLVKKPSDGLYGSSNTSGAYTGMIGALQRKEVDIGMQVVQIIDHSLTKFLLYSFWY